MAVFWSLVGGAHNIALGFDGRIEPALLGPHPDEVEVGGPDQPGPVLALLDAGGLAGGRLQVSWVRRH